jgi:hypothetical protein
MYYIWLLILLFSIQIRYMVVCTAYYIMFDCCILTFRFIIPWHLCPFSFHFIRTHSWLNNLFSCTFTHSSSTFLSPWPISIIQLIFYINYYRVNLRNFVAYLTRMTLNIRRAIRYMSCNYFLQSLRGDLIIGYLESYWE